ncbi:MAG: hypothetical protein V4773_29765 [Verrucomicrobiota bacterium]
MPATVNSRYILAACSLWLAGCLAVAAAQAGRQLPIDQVPMYGGMDRQAVPLLKKADEDFIQRTSAAFGGRERAAATWVEQGFKFHKAGDLPKAMARFNQAWLLDPKNPEVYWGFGSVLHDRNEAFAAYDMLKRAYALGFRDAGFLADLGKVALVRIVERKDLAETQKASFQRESEGFFDEAVKTQKDLGYIYGVWASARYWQEDYAGAWAKVNLARTHGGVLPPAFLKKLSQKMPEPK